MLRLEKTHSLNLRSLRDGGELRLIKGDDGGFYSSLPFGRGSRVEGD